MATKKEWGGGRGGEREEGREVNSYISDALVLCRSADLLILLFFFNSSGAKAENSSKWSETL